MGRGAESQTIERVERSVDALKLQVNGLRASLNQVVRALDRISYQDNDNDEFRVENPLAARVRQLESERDMGSRLAKNYKERLEYALHYKNQPREFRRLVVDLFKAINGYVPGDGDGK